MNKKKIFISVITVTLAVLALAIGLSDSKQRREKKRISLKNRAKHLIELDYLGDLLNV